MAKTKRWKPKEADIVFQIWYDNEDSKYYVRHGSYGSMFSRHVLDLKQGRLFRTKREAFAVCKKLNKSIKQILKGA